jgi:hypothetical protein
MCKFKTPNTNIITNNQIEDILDLVTGTFLNGVTSHDEISLFELGFLYDSNAEILLMTTPSYKWVALDSELYFSINSLSMSEVNEFYVDNKLDIDTTMSLWDGEWNLLDELDKLFLLEQYNGWLSRRFSSMQTSIGDLLTFLEDYNNNFIK